MSAYIIYPFRSGGDGRTRTAVQTAHPKAFYTFSLHMIVGRRLPAGTPYPPYLLKSRCKAGDSLQPSPLWMIPHMPGSGRRKSLRDTRLAGPCPERLSDQPKADQAASA